MSSGSGNVFEIGKNIVLLVKVEPETTSPSPSSVPKSLLIATPSEEGHYPVLVFLHGFLLYNYFYSQLIQHIASHGFIVVAPQLYKVAGGDSTEEINSVITITEWLSDGLKTLLPPLVQPKLTKLAIAGHSRGGKVAFAHSLTLNHTNTARKYSVLMGVDPVDGMSKGSQTPPPVLTYTPQSFNLNIPVLVVGSGLGELKRNILFPPCAPKGVNHENFFDECRSPSCYFVAKDYGHVDMLDDETKGIRGKATYCTCKSGKAREPMRRFVGGIMIAFMRAYLEDDFGGLVGIREKQVKLPVELQNVEFRM